MVNSVLSICDTAYLFDDFEEIGAYFKKIINLLRQMNYQEFHCPRFRELEAEIDTLLAERRAPA
jgi:V/A-type H+-transporting ATPase subunit A